MKKQLMFVIVALLLASGCNAVGVAYLPKQNPVSARKSNLARLHDQACAGVAEPYCIRYRNELGAGKAILAFLVNGRPKPIQAIGVDENGFDKPEGMLKPGEEMFVALTGCERGDADEWNNHFCRYTLVAYVYSTETLATLEQAAGKDQLLRRFIDVPHVGADEDGDKESKKRNTEACYAMTIDRYNRVQNDPLAHNRNGDENRPPCPQPDRSTAQVAAR